MKKYLYAILIFISCFILSSFSLGLLYPFIEQEEIIDKHPDENTQKAYAVLDAVNSYTPAHIDSDNYVVDELNKILSSNMIVDFDAILQSLENNNQNIVVTAKFIDASKIALENNIDFDFTEYNNYFNRLSENAISQLLQIDYDSSMYTAEYDIRVTFKNTDNNLKQTAVLNNDDLESIQTECHKNAENIYKDYLNTSEMSTAFFCQSIKELPLDNIVEIYNNQNDEMPITEEWEKELFVDYSQHYIDNLIIENILKANTNSEDSKGTINYKIEQAQSVFDAVCKQLLNTYYIEKQPPVEKTQVIKDFADELKKYNYDTEILYSKSFDFTYSQNLNKFTINDDFYIEIVDDIFEEFTKFEEIFNPYFTEIEELYFFVERPFDGTTIILDTTGETNYRQVDIQVTGATDCYIKLYTYDAVTDSLKDTVYLAYIKAGEQLQVFVPEGDYIFKYATGPKWYGDVHMFSDEGQYFAGSKVISVHEYMMTTTIELGNFESGSIPTYSQTPDLF